MKKVICPFCSKDLSQATRLFGEGVMTYHLRIHEVDLINRIFEGLANVAEYYKDKPLIPLFVRYLLEDYRQINVFYACVDQPKENQDEE